MGIISIKNLGKAFRQYPSKAGRLMEWLSFGALQRHSKKWVFRSLDLEINPGESVGIIGINGAGKSTLLKIITGTLQANEGTVSVNGRLVALLELGMGFHPDFTGRQNVYMSGQIQGLSDRQISELMPAIEEFAEIGGAIDQPLRIYSSGMQMRLAFSVATALRPDILIVDEALSVGDTYFQHKSFSRIKEFSALGTTLLIVSHDKQAIQALCSRAVLLKDGAKVMDGEPEAVMDYYNALIAEKENTKIENSIHVSGKTSTESGTGEAKVENISITNHKGEIIETVIMADVVFLNITVMVMSNIDQLVVGFGIKDKYGQVVFGTNTHQLNSILTNVAAGNRYTFKFKMPMNIAPGAYSIQTALHDSDNHLGKNYQWCDLALIFNIVNQGLPLFSGSTWLPADVKISALSAK